MNQHSEIVKQRRREVVALTGRGFSAPHIAAVLGITERSVIRHRQRAGITQGQKAPPMTEHEIRRAAELLDDGCSYNETARTLGRDPKTLQRRFPGRGWTPQQQYEMLPVLRRCNIQMSKHEGVFIK